MSEKIVFCENLFEKLKKEDPDTLQLYINESGMSAGHLTLALPYLGETREGKYLSTILHHLIHESPIVREGAMIALWEYAGKFKEVVLMEYKYISETDANATLRTMAKDYLIELNESYDFWFGEKE